LRVAHHLKDDITTAVSSLRKGKVATALDRIAPYSDNLGCRDNDMAGSELEYILRPVVAQRTARFSRQKPLNGRRLSQAPHAGQHL